MSDSTTTPRMIVVMGVSAAGKTEVGRALATALGWPFYDADDYHSAENIAKMHAGHGLTDADREPWLEALRAMIAQVLAAGERGVLACSALKESYRAALRPGTAAPGDVRFVYLDVPRDVLAERLRTRRGHFAPPALLDSQLATLEKPHDALWVDGTCAPSEIVATVRAKLGL